MKQNRIELVLAFCALLSLFLIAGEVLQFWKMELWLRILTYGCFGTGLIGLQLLGIRARQQQHHNALKSEHENDLNKG